MLRDEQRRSVRRASDLVQTPMSPGGTVDLHKIAKLCFEGEWSWKRDLGWQQLI
jgi:hypothetical protein